MKRKLVLLTLIFLYSIKVYSQNFITEKNEPGAFPIITASETTSIYVDENDDWLIHRAASLLQGDIERVTGKKPGIISAISPSTKNLIIIGTINKSSLID